MRTTVTLDADTEALLRNEVARTGLGLEMVLNQAVRRALGRQPGGVRVEPLFPAPFPPTLAKESLTRLAAAWEDEDTIRKLGAGSFPA